VVADRSWAAAADEAGWTVTERFERRVHGSLTRHVHVLRREVDGGSSGAPMPDRRATRRDTS
jgi:hypothetical protein